MNGTHVNALKNLLDINLINLQCKFRKDYKCNV